jgi:hypothetical protein
MRLKSIALALCVAWQSSAAQAPEGYYYGPGVALPDTLYARKLGGDFSIRVDRVVRNESDARLLVLAERLFPTRDSVLRAQSWTTTPILLRRLEAAAAAPGDRWWWDEVDRVWTPFAVTGAAVSYFMTRLEERSRGGNPFGGAAHGGSFEYTARVESASSGADSRVERVVRQTLVWYYHCGPLCAMGFKHERVVECDRAGRPLRVSGDGRPDVWMS